MGDLLIRNIPESVRSGLKDKARESGRSLSEEVKLRLVRSLAEDEVTPQPEQNAYDAIRSIFVDADALMTHDEHADFIRAVEEGRRDFGRPVPEFE